MGKDAEPVEDRSVGGLTTAFNARRLKVWAYIAAVLVGLPALSPIFLLLAVIFEGYDPKQVPLILAKGVMHACWFLAIWVIARRLSKIGRGYVLAADNGRALILGSRLIVTGVLINLFLIPVIEEIMRGGSWFFTAIGHSFDNAALVLGVVGGTLQIAGRIMVTATSLRTELDEFL